MKKLIVFDTNVLLDLYSISRDNSELIISFFDDSDYDLYISDFVNKEFIRNYRKARLQTGGRNRIGIFSNEFNDKIASVKNKLESIIGSNLYKGFESSITEDTRTAIDSIINYTNKVQNEIDKIKTKVDFDFSTTDPVLDFVNKIVIEKPFKIYTQNELIHMSIYANQRIQLGLKPGLTDANKDTDRFSKYYDIFIWMDLLDCAATYDEIVFLENENKDDWWDIPQKTPASSVITDWNDKYGTSKSLRIMSLVNFLSEHYELVDSDALLQLSTQTEKLNNDIKNLTMVNDDILENIYNWDFPFEDILIGQSVRYGTVEDVSDAEPIDNPTFIIDSAKTEFYNNDKTLVIKLKAKLSYTADIVETYGRDSYPNSYHVSIDFLVDSVLTYAVLLDRGIDYELIDDDYDFKNADCQIHILKDYSEDDYNDQPNDGKDFCPECGTEFTEENYNMNGMCVKCNSKGDED